MPAPLLLEWAATLDHVTVMRRRFAAWLAASGPDADVVEDLVLAVYEVLVNAVEHAYTGLPEPGTVSLRAEIADPALPRTGHPGPGHGGGGQLRVTVADRGTWRTRESPRAAGGRGLALVRGLVDDTHVEPTPSGTTVHLRHRLGPAGS